MYFFNVVILIIVLLLIYLIYLKYLVNENIKTQFKHTEGDAD